MNQDFNSEYLNGLFINLPHPNRKYVDREVGIYPHRLINNLMRHIGATEEMLTTLNSMLASLPEERIRFDVQAKKDDEKNFYLKKNNWKPETPQKPQDTLGRVYQEMTGNEPPTPPQPPQSEDLGFDLNIPF